jgi:hypothetical protein
VSLQAGTNKRKRPFSALLASLTVTLLVMAFACFRQKPPELQRQLGLIERWRLFLMTGEGLLGRARTLTSGRAFVRVRDRPSLSLFLQPSPFLA